MQRLSSLPKKCVLPWPCCQRPPGSRLVRFHPCAIVGLAWSVDAALGTPRKTALLLTSHRPPNRPFSQHPWCGLQYVLSSIRAHVLVQGDPSCPDKDSVLAIAAAAEENSEHPVARAICAAARTRGCSFGDGRHCRNGLPIVEGFSTVPGMGVSCTLVEENAVGDNGTGLHGDYHGNGDAGGGESKRRLVLVGTRAWLKRHGVRVSNASEDVAATLEWQGKTVVFVALGSETVGGIAVADQPRPEAREAVSALTR